MFAPICGLIVSLTMKRFSVCCAAFVASVAALAGLVPTGVAFADEGRVSDAASEPVSSNGIGVDLSEGTVIYHVGAGVHLGEASTSIPRNPNGANGVYHLEPLYDVGEKGAGFNIKWRNNVALAEVSWPIQDTSGKATGYSVTTRFRVSPVRFLIPHCTIMGPDGPDQGPFQCTIIRRGLDYDWDMYVTDSRVNRWAETSGSIKTERSISLEDGKFWTESAKFLRGASQVAGPWNGGGKQPSRSTQFDAVLTEGNQTQAPDSARMGFTYALLDDGQPVYDARTGKRLYVIGNASNDREKTEFKGNSSCVIGTLGGGPAENTGYACYIKDHYAYTGVKDGRINHITDFRVSKRW
jgi:hypothetical protein